MSSYQCRDFLYKDNTVSRPSYLYTGTPHTVFILRRDLAGWRLMTLHGCLAPRRLSVGYVALCDVTACTWNDQAGINTLRPKQNGRHLSNDVLKWIFLHGNYCIFIKILLKVVPKDLFEYVSVDSDDFLQPKRRQVIIWTNDGLLYYSPIQTWPSGPLAVFDIKNIQTKNPKAEGFW